MFLSKLSHLEGVKLFIIKMKYKIWDSQLNQYAFQEYIFKNKAEAIDQLISFFSLEKNIPANLPIFGNLMNKITKKRDNRIMKTKKMTIEKLIDNKNLLKNFSPGIFFEYKGTKSLN